MGDQVVCRFYAREKDNRQRADDSLRRLAGVGGSMTFQSSAIQIQEGKYRGRIVLPYYLEMDGEHPDYDRKQRGGYALFKGFIRRTLLL